MRNNPERHIEALKSIPETPNGNLGSININDFIAFLTRVARTDDVGDLKNMENVAGIYSHIRDKTNARTANEADTALEKRKIEPKVVQLWIEEGMIRSKDLSDAIKKGYPELKDKIEEIRGKWLKEISGKE